ncbi:MAG: polyphosphate polymerase domain-containing protein [Myxococcota bacterium]|jgi:hypothetical protein
MGERMGSGSMVTSRYESKYLISVEKAALIRDYISPLCSPDSHAGADGRYVVNNLYFDTPDLRFYCDTKFRKVNRFKPRVRYYGDDPSGLLWLELKHKMKNVTWKTRRSIQAKEWGTLFERWGEESDGCLRTSLRDSFEGAVLRYGAAPVVHVRYVREPYVSEIENYCRITFDRYLSYRLTGGSYELTSPDRFRLYDDAVTASLNDEDSLVLLEIKTETDVPFWVMHMVQCFELQQRGFSKYCYSIDSCREGAAIFHRTSAFCGRGQHAAVNI